VKALMCYQPCMVKPQLNNNTVYIIDGSGYIFRAYFAVRSLKSSKGVPTNAVFGFSTMLLKLLREHQPKYVAIAFDLKTPTFRHQIYPAYKANRPEAPADLIPQFALISQVVDAFKIKRLVMPGFEADDIIGTLAHQARRAGHEVVIVTGDKDLMQLVGDGVFLLDELRASKHGSELFIDADAVKNQLGVWPHQVIDMLALAGDASDNIPGVAGIGQKTAAELIAEFGPLEKILEMAPLISQKSRREKIIGGHKLALLSKQLVTIDCEVKVACELSDLIYQGPDQARLQSLFRELEFNRLLKDQVLFNDPALSSPIEPLVTEKKWLWQEVKRLALMLKQDLSGVLLAWGDQDQALVSIDTLARLMAEPQRGFIAHNAKASYKILSYNNYGPLNIIGDPMLANYLLYQDQEPHDLASLSMKYFGRLVLAHEEAELVLKLENILLPKLELTGLSDLYKKLELPLEAVLARMEMRGVKIDTRLLAELNIELSKRLGELEQEAYQLAGCEFNLASPKQLGEILFDKLNLAKHKKTKTGYSTDFSVLEKLSNSHPLPKLLLEHRVYAKLLSTYINSLPSLIKADTGRLHTSYNQVVTATGRLSSSDPNLQNIPVRTKEGRRIRQAFIAEPGCVIISLDYSQVELRLLALVSQDPVLLDSFAKDEDVHKRTASEIFDVNPDLVSKEQRNAAKTINFGLLYGMGAHKLAATLKISREQAANYLKKYFAKYAGILAWKERVLAEARKTQQVRTLFGRLRLVPELGSNNPMLISRGERLAVNTPIQGTAADIIKKAMIDTDSFLAKHYPQSSLIMQVHDELVIEASSKDAHNIAEAVSAMMSTGHGLDVDLKVIWAMGTNWDEAH